MPAPIFIPPPIGRSKECERCGLRYPARKPECPHCKGLSEREVENLRQQAIQKHRANAHLGKLFLALAALIILGLLLFF